MKKFKKGLAVLLGAVVIGSSVAGLNVHAAFASITENFTAPTGYEEHAVLTNGVMFKEIDNFSLYYLNGFQYNRIELQLSENADWDSIAEQYWTDLEFDSVSNSNKSVVMYDKKENAGDPRTPTDIDDKFEAIADVCTEMYKAGLLESAEYTQMFAILSYGSYERKLEAASFKGTEEDLKQVVTSVCEDASISIDETESVVYVNFSETDATYDDIVEVKDLIEATFLECDVQMPCWFYDGGDIVATASINLLSALESDSAIRSGDLNTDGKIGILDVIVLSKANAGIITLNAECTAAADLNADSVVNGDDLTVLMRYLVELIDEL